MRFPYLFPWLLPLFIVVSPFPMGINLLICAGWSAFSGFLITDNKGFLGVLFCLAVLGISRYAAEPLFGVTLNESADGFLFIVTIASIVLITAAALVLDNVEDKEIKALGGFTRKERSHLLAILRGRDLDLSLIEHIASMPDAERKVRFALMDYKHALIMARYENRLHRFMVMLNSSKAIKAMVKVRFAREEAKKVINENAESAQLACQVISGHSKIAWKREMMMSLIEPKYLEPFKASRAN